MTCLSTHDELIIDVGKKQQKETTNVITWQGYGITGQRTTVQEYSSPSQQGD
jgi:hypothetical protein